MTAVHAAIYASVSRNCANHYYNHFREKIADHLRKAPRFEGEVEIDQAYFGKGVRRWVDIRTVANPSGYGDSRWPGLQKKKRKYTNKVMVLGIARREGDVYTHIIKKEDRNTISPIIHLVVEPGSTVYTDKWAGFTKLEIDGYTHKSVSHEKGFVGRDGTHTGNIDAFWGETRRHLGHFRGISRRTFPLHLKECELRYNMKEKKELLKFMKKLVFPRKTKVP